MIDTIKEMETYMPKETGEMVIAKTTTNIVKKAETSGRTKEIEKICTAEVTGEET